jgi:hypothetical protein
MKRFKIVFDSHYVLEFRGEYVRQAERPNWHYYKTHDGRIIHCRKDKMLLVESSEVDKE